MRRLALPLLVVAAAAGCVSVEPAADPHGALKPGQRLVVIVNQSPGPWLLDASDSKAAALAKISPLGFVVAGVQDSHTLAVSQEIQQYLPRPHYGLEVRDALMKALKVRISSAPVQTGYEAGISLQQLEDWNKSTDQLDWRRHYYAPDPDAPPTRDYAKILTLDDALVLDVNVSFGTTADETDKIMPQMSAASRVYRGDTSHMIWSHEDELTDKTSSATLSEFELAPEDLTNRIEKLAPGLGTAVADSFIKAFGLSPSTMTKTASSTATIAGLSGGLVPMSFFQNMSTAAPAGLLPGSAFAAPASTEAVAASTAAAVSPALVPAVSSTTAPAPPAAPAVSSGTIPSAASPPSASTTTAPAAPPP